MILSCIPALALPCFSTLTDAVFHHIHWLLCAKQRLRCVIGRLETNFRTQPLRPTVLQRSSRVLRLLYAPLQLKVVPWTKSNESLKFSHSWQSSSGDVSRNDSTCGYTNIDTLCIALNISELLSNISRWLASRDCRCTCQCHDVEGQWPLHGPIPWPVCPCVF